METRTYWLSFCDPDKPAGTQFLGVAVVDVTAEDASDPMNVIRCLGSPEPEEAIWLAAAITKAHATGCNPGGQVQAADLTAFRDHPEAKAMLDKTPRHTLMPKDELAALGHEPVTLDEFEAEFGDGHTVGVGPECNE